MCWSATGAVGDLEAGVKFVCVCSAFQHHMLCVTSGNSSVTTGTSLYLWRELLGVNEKDYFF